MDSRPFLLLQHTNWEVADSVIAWLFAKGLGYEVFRPFTGEPFPAVDRYQAMIVFGGPMNVDQDEQHPWLRQEKLFIESFLKRDGKYLGLCLGGQLLARVLGAPVTKNPHLEIGWHELHKLPHHFAPFAAWPVKSHVFQWHEDTFALPSGATALFKSQACTNQGYVVEGKWVGLQFHPESTANWIHKCYTKDYDPKVLTGLPHVQHPELALANTEKFLTPMQQEFHRFLDLFFWK